MKKNIRRKTSVLMILTMLLLPVNFAYGAEAEINEEVSADAGSENVIEEVNTEPSDESSIKEEASNPVEEEPVITEQIEAPAEPETSEETAPSETVPSETAPSETAPSEAVPATEEDTPEDQTPKEEAFEDISEKKESEGVSSDEVFAPIEPEEKEISISENFTPVSENSTVSDNQTVSPESVSQADAAVSDNEAVSENAAVSENSGIISLDFPTKTKLVVDPYKIAKKEHIYSEKYVIKNDGDGSIKIRLCLTDMKTAPEMDGFFELVIHTDNKEMKVTKEDYSASIELELKASGEEGDTDHIWFTGKIEEESPYYHLERIGGIEELSENPLDVTLRYKIIQ